MFVMIRINHDFMEYMRETYPTTPLSDFKTVNPYVERNTGLDVWRKMRRMRRTVRSETRSGGLTEFMVYKD